MNRARFIDALIAGVCYSLIAGIGLGTIAPLIEAAIVAATDSRLTGEATRPATTSVTLTGILVAFTATFWRSYHKDSDAPP